MRGRGLRERLDERARARYETAGVEIRRYLYQVPHMAVRGGDTLCTSVVGFLERVDCAG